MAVRRKRTISVKGAGSAPAPSTSGGIKKRTNIPVEPDVPEFGGEVGQIINKLTKDGSYGSPFIKASSRRMNTTHSRTGVLATDLCLGGGWTRSRAGMLYGEKSCLAGDTFVNYHVIRPDGTAANTKGGTIEQLFNRFHGVPKGKGAYIRPGMENCSYTAPSIDCSGAVIHNVIEDVWETGEQECFRVITSRGHGIDATDKHRFYTGEDYVRLALLEPGSTVFVHENRYRFKETDELYSAADRAYVYVHKHPVAGIKISKGYKYHRLARARAVIEAEMNNLTLARYLELLNVGIVEGMVFLRRDQHVHHKNNDHTDDALDNLEVMTNEEHGTLHGNTTRRGVVFEAVPDEIVSIESVGVIPTYDVQMRDPYNNFVANKFVVHNSGKSTKALQSIATIHKVNPDALAAWIDVEGTLDKAWARKLGVDLERLIVVEPETGEHAVDLADAMLRAKEVEMVVTDSIAMLVPMKELEESSEKDTMALQARLVGKYIRRTNNALIKERGRAHLPILIHINQFRMKVGLVFGDPRTLPGGKALEFSTTQQIEIKNKEHTGKDDSGNDVVLYNEHNIKITKNKGGGPMKEAAFKLIRTEGYEDCSEAWIDQAKTFFRFGHQVGVITGSPQSFQIEGAGTKFKGAPAFNRWAQENPLKYDEAQAKIILGFRKKWDLE